MASSDENLRFTNEMISHWPLDKAIAWIQSNLKPDDVFEKDQLDEFVNKELVLAIKETIEENLHLADGDVCTLIKLKRAINYA